MSKRSAKTDLARATTHAGDSLSSAVESASQTVASGIDDIVQKGRKARRQAQAEAQRRRKEAEKAARKKVRKAKREVTKVGDDVKADAQFRKEALAAAAAGDPKRRGSLKKFLGALLAVGGAAFVAAKSRGAGNRTP